MNWYLVRQFITVKITGPCLKWQDACLQTFGHIAPDMEVKCLGNNNYYINKPSWIQDQKNDPNGWFRPYIPGGKLVLSAEKAMGPPEIATALSQHADKILNAKTVAEAEIEWHEANQYLQWIPMTAAAKFSDLYNTTKERLEAKENALAQQQLDDDGCQKAMP